MRLLLSPHDDDNALFAAFTCIREKPIVIVVTDSYRQPARGEIGCSAAERAAETAAACRILGCEWKRLGIRDDLDPVPFEAFLRQRLRNIWLEVEAVYAPAVQGGNWQHDSVGKVAKEIFGTAKVFAYTTYSKQQLYTTGTHEIRPTEAELELKNRALECYVSQLACPATRPHFDAVRNQSEWYE